MFRDITAYIKVFTQLFDYCYFFYKNRLPNNLEKLHYILKLADLTALLSRRRIMYATKMDTVREAVSYDILKTKVSLMASPFLTGLPTDSRC